MRQFAFWWVYIHHNGGYNITLMKVKNIIISLIVGLVSVASILGIAFEVKYWKKVYPGLRVGKIEVGGSSLAEAASKVSERANLVKSLELVWGVNKWNISLASVDLKYEFNTSAMEVIQLGRSGNIFDDLNIKLKAGFDGLNINPLWSWNDEKMQSAIASIAAQIDVPAQEPEILRGPNKDSVVISPGENGQQVNRDMLLKLIRQSLESWGDKNINIPVTEIKPRLSNEQVEKVKNKAIALLGKVVVIQNPEADQKWEIKDDQLLTWLNLQTGEWKSEQIKEWVVELAQTVNKEPQNATFRFTEQEKVEEFYPARDGVSVLEETTTDGIVFALNKLENNSDKAVVELVLKKTKPEIETGDANSLGIRELIGKGESWFTGSITNRIFNLKKAAGIINGVLIAPGEIFSFNKVIGEVSQNTGFKQAYIIKEGKTILGDGGGVCQVSTTLFRAVLNAGLPIDSRTAHAYRVSYYEVKYQPGFDATVFQPSLDFVFRNDTQAYILIQTVYDEKNKYLSFELYGTSDGRKVELSKARIWEVIPPPPDLYQDDPTLPVGKIVQTEHAAYGAKVAFDWKVTRGEEVLQQKTFFSNYKSWQAVYLRGTKTN